MTCTEIETRLAWLSAEARTKLVTAQEFKPNLRDCTEIETKIVWLCKLVWVCGNQDQMCVTAQELRPKMAVMAEAFLVFSPVHCKLQFSIANYSHLCLLFFSFFSVKKCSCFFSHHVGVIYWLWLKQNTFCAPALIATALSNSLPLSLSVSSTLVFFLFCFLLVISCSLCCCCCFCVCVCVCNIFFTLLLLLFVAWGVLNCFTCFTSSASCCVHFYVCLGIGDKKKKLTK